MEKDTIKILLGGIKRNIKDRHPYSSRMAVSLSIEMFKIAFKGEKTLESLAYQRGAEQGIIAVLRIIDELIEEENAL